MVKDVTPRQFVELRAAGAELQLIDVREEWELALAAVPTTVLHIPMGQIADRLAELDRGKDTVVICRSGGRSLEVARFLAGRGFASVANLTGGILQWSRDLDPTIAQY